MLLAFGFAAWRHDPTVVEPRAALASQTGAGAGATATATAVTVDGAVAGGGGVAVDTAEFGAVAAVAQTVPQAVPVADGAAGDGGDGGAGEMGEMGEMVAMNVAVSPEAGAMVRELAEGARDAAREALEAPKGREATTKIETLDAGLQRFTEKLYKEYDPPFAATVLIEVKTGKVLVYASHNAKTGKLVTRDTIGSNDFPAASLFKIVTAGALIDEGAVSPQTEHCFSGSGKRGLTKRLLNASAGGRGARCMTVQEAMGKSNNVVFGRLAHAYLDAGEIEAMARRFGFLTPLAPELAVVPSRLSVPRAPALALAETAAGFGEVLISPMHAALMAQAIANDGVMLKPQVRKGAEAEPLLTIGSPAFAKALEETMRTTATKGTAKRGFMRRGMAHIGRETVGKTGSLARRDPYRDYGWFIGYAPQRDPEVAVASLVLNDWKWKIKAWYPASEVLREYFERKPKSASLRETKGGAAQGVKKAAAKQVAGKKAKRR